MIVEKKYYKGYRVALNNTSKLHYIRVVPRERLIEYDPEFFARLDPDQEFFMLEWAIRNRRVKDPFQCDNLTIRLYKNKGLDVQKIINLYKSMQFATAHHKQQRIANITGSSFDALFGQKQPWYKILWNWINRQMSA